MAKQSERRREPRIADDRVALKVKTDKFDTSISQSLNISASGVYCKVDRELPLMSRVKIILMLPSDTVNKKSDSNKIETEGVVVREHPVIENGKIMHYDAAIFFDNLTPQQSLAIKEYIQKRPA
ncbi:MAG: PilZ domain-containing protein [Candidatus Omnitrophica bacterium]|nr:PilZ domain-containing protein [Candidatus Omnitrophota bacterium]